MRTFRHETGLYMLAIVVGLLVRFIGLGALPLSDAEASWALQAFNISQGNPTALGSQPLYVVLTSGVFFLVGGTTNALARLIPALAGTALVLVPALLRERIKPRPAVILAFAFALEPGLVALSRQAGSAIVAVVCLLATLGFWDHRNYPWAGACAGLALLSGPALWPGLLGLAIAWALLRPFERSTGREKPRKAASAPAASRSPLLSAGAFALGTIILVGTLFMTVPAGLSAWLGSLPDYISSWTRTSDMPPKLMLGSLIGYQPLELMLAAVATFRGWVQGSLRVRRLSLWMLAATLLAVFNPSRQVTDLAWMLIPLCALASLEIARHLNVLPEERGEVLGAAALAAVMLILIWLSFLSLRRPALPPDEIGPRTWQLFGSFFLLILSLLLVGVGWSIRVAQHGALWGLALVLGVYSLGGSMAAAGLRGLPNTAEMWRTEPGLPMADLVLRTVQDYSAWSSGDPDSQPVVIAGVQSPALEWLLRERPVEVREMAAASTQPPLVITPETQNAELAAGYRGQSLVWRKTPVWKLVDFIQWLPFHEAAHQNENVIVWVRADLFPDSNARRTP